MGSDLSQLIGHPDALKQRILDLQREERFVKKLLRITLEARGDLPRTHAGRKDVIQQCAPKT
jgi:hypothetical protein